MQLYLFFNFFSPAKQFLGRQFGPRTSPLTVCRCGGHTQVVAGTKMGGLVINEWIRKREAGSEGDAGRGKYDSAVYAIHQQESEESFGTTPFCDDIPRYIHALMHTSSTHAQTHANTTHATHACTNRNTMELKRSWSCFSISGHLSMHCWHAYVAHTFLFHPAFLDW